MKNSVVVALVIHVTEKICDRDRRFLNIELKDNFTKIGRNFYLRRFICNY